MVWRLSYLPQPALELNDITVRLIGGVARGGARQLQGLNLVLHFLQLLLALAEALLGARQLGREVSSLLLVLKLISLAASQLALEILHLLADGGGRGLKLERNPRLLLRVRRLERLDLLLGSLPRCFELGLELLGSGDLLSLILVVLGHVQRVVQLGLGSRHIRFVRLDLNLGGFEKLRQGRRILDRLGRLSRNRGELALRQLELALGMHELSGELRVVAGSPVHRLEQLRGVLVPE